MSEKYCADDEVLVCPEADSTRAAPAWNAVLSLALGVFALVIAEFLPASLLTLVAADLGISDGVAGQAVTATAVVAAFAGPLVVIYTAKMDRRRVIWALSLLLVLSNLLAAAAANIWVLIAARACLGVALGGVWSLVAALALRLVPPRLLPRAMMIIFTGVSTATVCAPALGAYLGDILGWRATFLAAAAIGIAGLMAQLLTLPPLPPADAPQLNTFSLLLKRPRVRIGLITVICVISGHFAGFTYVRPFLEQTPRFDVNMISLALLAFGAGGFLGNIAGGYLAGRSARIAIAAAALTLSSMAFLLLILGSIAAVAFAATAIWGFAFGALPVSTQTWNTQAAPDHAETAGAILLTTFQIAISLGAAVGGLLVEGFGAQGVIFYSAVAVLAGGVIMLAAARPSEARAV